MYRTIPEWMTVDERGWAARVIGRPPYLITQMGNLENGFYSFQYICPNSPTPIFARGDQELKNMYNLDANKDLLFAYYGDLIESKDFDALMRYYDRRIKDQTENILSQLDWDAVKVDQQSQFMQGVRVAKTIPLLGLKMCLDAYNFDDFWANVDWSNPMTYFNCIKEVVGLANVGLKPRTI